MSYPSPCPENPNLENCGLAAAQWLRSNELLYADFDKPDEFDAIAKAEGEVMGVTWDSERAGAALELVDKTGNVIPVAKFMCRACSSPLSVEFAPFNAINIYRSKIE